jgi:hypothetical protein
MACKVMALFFHVSRIISILICLAMPLLPTPAQAHDPALRPAQVLDAIGFDQRLNETMPQVCSHTTSLA